MDETLMEYPSQDYHKIDEMIEDRGNTREQTPKRNLDIGEYQPRKLVSQKN